jgi:hypothetical protein
MKQLIAAASGPQWPLASAAQRRPRCIELILIPPFGGSIPLAQRKIVCRKSAKTLQNKELVTLCAVSPDTRIAQL